MGGVYSRERKISLSKDLEVGETTEGVSSHKQSDLNGTWHSGREVGSGNLEYIGKTRVSVVSTKSECVTVQHAWAQIPGVHSGIHGEGWASSSILVLVINGNKRNY